MEKLLIDYLFIFFDFLTRILENFPKEISVFLIFIFIYYFALFILKRVKISVFLRKFLKFLMSLTFMSATLILSKSLRNLEILIFLHYIFYFLSLYYFLKIVDEFIKMGNLLKFIYNLSIIFNTIFAFSLSICKGKVDETFLNFNKLGFNITTSVFAGILILKSLKFFIEKAKYGIIKRTFETVYPFVVILYILISALWILNFIEFSRIILIKVITLIAILLAYFLVTYLILENGKKYLGDFFESFRKDLRNFLFSLSFFVFYKLSSGLFDVERVEKFLRNIYIIDTKVLKISVFSLIEGIYVFIVFYFLTGILKNLIYSYFMSKNMEIEAGSFRALVSNIGLLFAAIISLSSIGLTFTALIPILGAIGVGLGFGLQTIFNNYVSGFILLLSKNIKVGDIVEIEGSVSGILGYKSDTIFGKVVNINILSTVIRTFDNVEIAVPNSEFLSKRIINYSLSNPIVRIRIPVGVSYSSDPEKVREILLKVAKKFDWILKNPPPDVWFYEFGDSALIFYLLVWVDLRKKGPPIRSSIYFEIFREFKKEGIEIPFPQRDVWFRNKLKVEIEKENQSL